MRQTAHVGNHCQGQRHTVLLPWCISQFWSLAHHKAAKRSAGAGHCKSGAGKQTRYALRTSAKRTSTSAAIINDSWQCKLLGVPQAMRFRQGQFCGNRTPCTRTPQTGGLRHHTLVLPSLRESTSKTRGQTSVQPTWNTCHPAEGVPERLGVVRAGAIGVARRRPGTAASASAPARGPGRRLRIAARQQQAQEKRDRSQPGHRAPANHLPSARAHLAHSHSNC